jgi:D-sedoheptulose 7-phosphate isomerase
MEGIKKSLNESLQVLKEFMDDEANILSIASAGEMMIHSLKEGGKVISFGNGGSMSDAMHFAEELTGRFRDDRPAISAVSISDPSHITCVANDYGFDAIFSRFIEANGRKGDVALAISTSGNSGNVIKACEAARKKGIKIVALTGKTGGKLAGMADVEIRVPHFGYSDRIQEVHIKVIHILIEIVEKGMSSER